jgi:predicted GNAT family acetyltransferase
MKLFHTNFMGNVPDLMMYAGLAQHEIWSKGQINGILFSQQDAAFYCLTDNENQVGGILVYSMTEDQDCLVISLLHTNIVHRKKGVASKLLKKFMDWAKETHPQCAVSVQTSAENLSAIRLYKQFFPSIETSVTFTRYPPEEAQK